MKIIVLIPARGGSQRVKNKNIRLLAGKPLIAYTIEVAAQAKLIDRIIVSTDSEEIATTSRKFGAEVPFLRPAKISQHNSTEMEFFLHALGWLQEHENYQPVLIVLLYPTSPFRTSASIERAVAEMQNHPEADSLRSVKQCSEHPYKMWVEEGGYLKPFVKTTDQNSHTLSYQLLPEVYIQNASIYITKPATILQKKSTVGDVVIPFIMDELESVDVNTPLDFEFAEWLMRKKWESKKK